MSQLKILKYSYAEQNTFQVADEYGNICWIKFEQAGPGDINDGTACQVENVFKPIPIEPGY